MPTDTEHGTHTPDYTPDELDTAILTNIAGPTISEYIDTIITTLLGTPDVCLQLVKRRRRLRPRSYIEQRIKALTDIGYLAQTHTDHYVRTTSGNQACNRGTAQLYKNPDKEPIERTLINLTILELANGEIGNLPYLARATITKLHMMLTDELTTHVRLQAEKLLDQNYINPDFNGYYNRTDLGNAMLNPAPPPKTHTPLIFKGWT